MRRAIWIAVLLVPAVALGRSGVIVGGRPGGQGGRHTGGGLIFQYNRSTSHSNLSLSFSGGTYYSGGSHRGTRPGTRYLGGYRSWTAYPGSTYIGSSSYYYGFPGVSVYRGWVPYPPGWYYSNVPYSASRGVGPFEYVDAVHFGGGGGVQVFGPPPAAPTAPVAVPPAVPPAYAQMTAAQLIEAGDDLFGRGHFTEAAVAYQAAASEAPRDAMAAYALGHGLFATGDYPGAASALRRGVQLFPGLLDVGMNRRDFYGDGGVYDRQLAQLERRVAAAPNDVGARFVLAYNYYFSQHRERARGHFSALGPADREARLFLARMGQR